MSSPLRESSWHDPDDLIYQAMTVAAATGARTAGSRVFSATVLARIWGELTYDLADSLDLRPDHDTCDRLARAVGVGIGRHPHDSGIITALFGHGFTGIGTLDDNGVNAILSAYFTRAYGRSLHNQLTDPRQDPAELHHNLAELIAMVEPLPNLSEAHAVAQAIRVYL